MEQRDYLMRQVEQLGYVLGKMLSKLLFLKDNGTLSMGIVNQVFTGELDFDIDQLITIEEDNLIDVLKNEKQFDARNLEKLADIFLFLAENVNSNNCDQLYRKSLMIYQYLEELDGTYSFDRNSKIDTIKEQLKNII